MTKTIGMSVLDTKNFLDKTGKGSYSFKETFNDDYKNNNLFYKIKGVGLMIHVVKDESKRIDKALNNSLHTFNVLKQLDILEELALSGKELIIESNNPELEHDLRQEGLDFLKKNSEKNMCMEHASLIDINFRMVLEAMDKVVSSNSDYSLTFMKDGKFSTATYTNFNKSIVSEIVYDIAVIEYAKVLGLIETLDDIELISMNTKNKSVNEGFDCLVGYLKFNSEELPKDLAKHLDEGLMTKLEMLV